MFTAWINRLEKINVRDIIFEVIQNDKFLQEQIIDLNVEDQLFERGVDARNQPLEPPYSLTTINYKLAPGSPNKVIDHVTTRDTGNFHESFKLRITKREIEIFATDPKTGELQRKYGFDIIGLTDENITEVVRNWILPELQNRVRLRIAA